MARLDNLQACITTVLRRGVPGDLIETGVWRGGATILIRAVLKAYGDTRRTVWVADSFQGLPKPDPELFPADAGDNFWTYPELAVSLEEVQANFEKYGLLDEQVRFLPGWFRDTLPSAPIGQLAVLRLDGDLYESTMIALRSLYPKLSPGGLVIVDDYALKTCRAAVDDFRAENTITEELRAIDWTGVFWRKSGVEDVGLSRFRRSFLRPSRRLHKQQSLLEEHTRELAERAAVSQAEFVPPGHFYSAIPDFLELETRSAQIYERDPLDVPGVDLQLDAQLALLAELTGLLEDIPFDDEPREGLRYHYRNGVFEHADGLFLHLLLRRFAPSRVIEVGSGFSSACTLDTVDRFLGSTRCTFIDPFVGVLESLLFPSDRDRIEIIGEPVQSVPVSVFSELDAGDLLFINSTHVSKAGSDVNYLIFDVMPALRPGVLVHLHDISPGFEYPKEWMRERRVWSESYLLRAFLQFNQAFEIVLWPSLLALARPVEFARFPKALENTGGSIYLRRTG